MSANSIILKIAQPYAEALVELGQKSHQLSNITKDILTVSEVLSSSTALRTFLASPIINAKFKKNVINEILVTQIGNITANFISVLIDRNRITLFDKIVEKYLILTYRLDSTTIAYLTTAIDFTDEQQQALINKLKLITQSQEIKLITKIDPSLIGGFTLQIKSKIIDTSLLGQLQKMALYLNTSSILN